MLLEKRFRASGTLVQSHRFISIVAVARGTLVSHFPYAVGNVSRIVLVHKSAYLMRKNNSLEGTARAFLILVHLFVVLAKTTT